MRNYLGLKLNIVANVDHFEDRCHKCRALFISDFLHSIRSFVGCLTIFPHIFFCSSLFIHSLFQRYQVKWWHETTSMLVPLRNIRQHISNSRSVNRTVNIDWRFLSKKNFCRVLFLVWIYVWLLLVRWVYTIESETVFYRRHHRNTKFTISCVCVCMILGSNNGQFVIYAAFPIPWQFTKNLLDRRCNDGGWKSAQILFYTFDMKFRTVLLRGT